MMLAGGNWTVFTVYVYKTFSFELYGLPSKWLQTVAEISNFLGICLAHAGLTVKFCKIVSLHVRVKH